MTTPDTQTAAAGTAATTATAATAAPKAPSKMGQCEAIFLRMTEKGHTNTRQSILAAFASEAQMTEHGANTYYASLCTKYKSQERKGIRAVREAKATVTDKPGSSTVVGGTATAGKKAGSKKAAPAAGTTDAPFSVAHTDASGVVTKVEPYFSQIIATQAQATAQASGITAHVVTGMATVGQPITMFTAAQIAGQ